MTTSIITGQKFCPITDVDIRGATAMASPSNLNSASETLPSYIPEWRGMDCFQRLLVAYHNIKYKFIYEVESLEYESLEKHKQYRTLDENFQTCSPY